MSNRIKVTAEYEIPETTKFDLLMTEYRAAKKYADENVSYYKPLADAAEDAKFDAIMEQLKVIIGYLEQIYQINKWYATVMAEIPRSPYYFLIEYISDGEYRIKWAEKEFTKDNFHRFHPYFCTGNHNILGNWEEWKIYQQLEQDALKRLQELIRSELSRAENQIKRLNNIIKGEETK